MTIRDYLMDMKRVGVAELKARLSHYLRAVRRGETVIVLDRDQPVARLVPSDAKIDLLDIRPARGRLRDVALPPPVRTDSDIVAELLRDRRSRG